MAHDVEDWTGQQLVQLVAQSGALMGDPVGSPLAADRLIETILSGPAPRVGTVGLGVSFKPSAGLDIAQAGTDGPFTVGTDTAVAPAWDAAPALGDFGIAAVMTSGAGTATVAPGWTAVNFVTSDGQVSVWIKANLAAAEAAPAFTSTGPVAGEPMMAQLYRCRNIDAAAAADQQATAAFGRPVQTLAFPAADVGFGDFVLGVFSWPLVSSATATFSDSLNNGATAVNAGNSGAVARSHHASFVHGQTVAGPAAVPVSVAAWPYDAVGTHAQAAGVRGTVTLPAVAGKHYVVAHISAALVQTGAGGLAPALRITDGAAIIWQRFLTVAAGLGNHDGVDLGGLGIRCSSGNSVTLDFSAAGATVGESVAIGAYLRAD